jgi:hypothetical protein
MWEEPPGGWQHLTYTNRRGIWAAGLPDYVQDGHFTTVTAMFKGSHKLPTIGEARQDELESIARRSSLKGRCCFKVTGLGLRPTGALRRVLQTKK